jgi:predicted TIM-barrel fold metal-dependent hydrolase
MTALDFQQAHRIDYPIVDVDVHIHEDPAELAQCAEGTLRRALELLPNSERWLDTPGYSPLTVYDLPVGEDPQREIHLVRSPNQLRTDLEQRGIDAAIIFTGRLLGVATRQEPTYPVGIMRAYNYYLAERWLNPARGIYGAIMVAPQDPTASAREIEKCAGIPGFAATHLPVAGVYPLWGHRQYDPIYAAAQAARLPIVLHGYTLVHSIFPYQLDQFDTALAKQLLAKPFGMMANFASLMTTGVPVRFPKLKIVFTECGFAWLPFMLWRLDRQYRWSRHEVPFYTSKPSEYARRQIYTTTHSCGELGDPQILVDLMARTGWQDNLLFATDWPHYDADGIESVLDLVVSEDWKRKILSENARAVFNMPQLSSARI